MNTIIQQHQPLRHVALVLFSFSLPLAPRIATWLAVLWFVLWLISGHPLRYAGGLRKKWIWPPILFYLLMLAGSLWSAYPDAAAASLETGLSLLVFPLLLGLSPNLQKPYPEKSIRDAFLGGCLIAIIICLGNGLWELPVRGWSALSYRELGAPLGFHPTYFALYLNFACLWAAESLRRGARVPGRYVLFLVIAFVFILLLAARMQLLIFLLLAGVYVLNRMYRRNQLGRGLLLLGAGFIVLSTLIWAIPVTRHRILRTVEQLRTDGQPNIRSTLWETSLESWQEAPAFGHGTGAVPAVLLPAYRQRQCEDCLAGPLNSHNQYLQSSVELGLLGLLFWLVILFRPLLQRENRHDPLLVFFLLLFSLSILTESMLATQRGTMFFGFFYTFLLWRRGGGRPE